MNNAEMVVELLRGKLFVLHKALVDQERVTYERIHGKVGSNQFLNALLTDNRYSWLRKISELIVWIDEILDPRELTADEEVQSVFNQARKLLNPSELGEEFKQKYQDSLQRNPDVILAHKEVRDALKLLP